MTRWAMTSIVAVGAALLLLRVGDAAAEQGGHHERLLLSEVPALDAAALDAEKAQGISADVQRLYGPGREFGVILWDELKPGRPGGSQPQGDSVGRGTTSISVISN